MTAQPEGRTRRVLLAVFSSVGFLLVGMVASLVATPSLLGYLGKERFGLTRTLFDAFSYVGLLELGLAGAARPVIVSAVATRDPELLAHTLRAISRSFLGPLVAKLVAAVALAFAFPLLFNVPPDLQRESRLAAAVLTLLVLATPTPVFQHLLAAQQREYRNGVVQGVQNLAVIALSVAAAMLGFGLVGQAGVFVVATLLASFALFTIVRPFFHAATARPDLEEEARGKLRRLNWPLFWRSICGRIGLASDRLFIAGLMTATVVTQFHISVRLVDVATPLIFTIGNSAWPALADIKHRGEQALFEERLAEVSLFIVVVAVLLLAPILVVSAPFVQRWVGGGVYLGHGLTTLAAFNAIILALTGFWEWCLASTGDPRKLLLPTLVATAVNVGVTLVATRWVGPLGPLLGTTAGMAGVLVAWDLAMLSRQLGVHTLALQKSCGRALLAGAVYVFLGLRFVAPHCRPSWLSIMLFAAVTGGGWLAIAWLMLLNPGMRQRTVGRISGMLRGRFAGA